MGLRPAKSHEKLSGRRLADEILRGRLVTCGRLAIGPCRLRGGPAAVTNRRAGCQPNATRFLVVGTIALIPSTFWGCGGFAPGKLAAVCPNFARRGRSSTAIRELTGSDQLEHAMHSGLVLSGCRSRSQARQSCVHHVL